MKLLLLPILIVLISCWNISSEETNYYKLLGVPRDATVKEIRKAFKILAVKLHPDKNKEDADADTKFVKLARAYETLKDPDARKHYDLHGETGSNKKQHYHSYTYYRDHFGIYDDDPLIVTLSRNDYEVNVLDNNQAWFVNFYSPNCHHCHDLAPAWRKLAVELEGVIRIGAVNCEDDWSLCHQMGIQAYPTLLYYEKEAHLFEGEKYRGERKLQELTEFILDKIKTDATLIDFENWTHQGLRKNQWLLFLCPDDFDNCPKKETIKKLSVILDGLVSVGLVKDKELCDKISDSHVIFPVVFWEVNDTFKTDEVTSLATVHNIVASDTKEILDNVLNILPNPIAIDDSKFQDIRTQLRIGADTPWLICFYLGEATDINLQLKRLPTVIPHINLGLVHCGKSAGLCSALHIVRYPTWGVLKVGGAFDVHHGRDVLHDVASFARDSAKSTNLHSLSPADFHNLINEGRTWFIDWYAPWCPPCRKLMPELRRASQHFDADTVQFGTVDCTLHRNLCTEEGITSYPTTMLYNGSKTHRFHGTPNEHSIVEFVHDMLNPPVISLDEDTFRQLQRKPKNVIWVVDYFAPWCGPCQRLGPEWRKLAKELGDIKEVKVAQVDCVENVEICNSQNIRAYPTIRLYPLGSKGLNTVAIYNGNRDAISLKRWVLGFLPSPVVALNAGEFTKQILSKKFILPWLVDFYAPWCDHCVHFEPEFRAVAQRLEGQIRSGKVDCEAERFFCGNLHITAYPSVMLYLSPTEKYKISSQLSSEIIQQVKRLIKDHKKEEIRDEL